MPKVVIDDKSARIPHFRVSEEFRKQTEEAAAKCGKGLSEYLRYAVGEMNKKVKRGK